MRRLSAARTAGLTPDSPDVLELMTEHYNGVREFWPADAAAYHAMADVMVDNPQQRQLVADVDEELPAWLAAAIRAYAVVRLGHGRCR